MTQNKVLAWHGDPDLKRDTILRMKKHAEQDRFIQGAYLTLPNKYRATPNNWAGCLHGCLTAENLAAEKGMSVPQWRATELGGYYDINWHKETERFFGIPAHVGSILDGIYEDNAYLPLAELAIQILEAIPVGADLSTINLRGDEEYKSIFLEDVLETLRNAHVPNREEGQ